MEPVLITTLNEAPQPFLPHLHRGVLVFLLLMQSHLAVRLLTILKEVVTLLFAQLALKPRFQIYPIAPNSFFSGNCLG